MGTPAARAKRLDPRSSEGLLVASQVLPGVAERERSFGTPHLGLPVTYEGNRARRCRL